MASALIYVKPWLVHWFM